MGRSCVDRAGRILVAILLTLGMSLNPAAAKTRRGAAVRVDLASGTQVQGELVVVGEASLTVRDRAGIETSYALGEIARVTVSWTKKKFPWGFVGFAAGATAGYLVGANPHDWAHTEDVLVLRGIGYGILWGTVGALIGSFATADKARSGETVFLFRDQSEDQVRENLKRLRELARYRAR